MIMWWIFWSVMFSAPALLVSGNDIERKYEI